MTFFEAITTTLQPRSQTSHGQASQNLKAASMEAAPQAAKPETVKAVRQAAPMESARLMMESRDAMHGHVPITGRTTLGSGSMAAAYLTEMRLQQELSDLQGRLSE